MRTRKVIFSSFVITILILSVPSSAFAVTYNPPTTIPNPIPAATDRFGDSVSVSGNSVLVGTPFNDTVAFASTGTAYLFDGTTGALLQTFNNPTPAISDFFGDSVSVSGNSVLVGAYGDNTGAADAGSAYLFDGTTGALLQTFNNPKPVANDQFGFSVSVSGNSVLVGARFNNTGGLPDVGSAYLFDGTTGALLQTFNNPTPAIADFFGHSVSVSGNSVLVGAFGDDTGASNAGSAYLFDGTTGALLQTFNNPTPVANDQFGESVSVSGNSVLVGAAYDDIAAFDSAGSAYLFDGTTGALLQTFNNPTPAVSDLFGLSVSVSGNSVLVGALGDETGAADAGSAYLFNGTTGALLQTFNNPTPAATDVFGESVSVSGNSVLVGARFDDTGASNAGAAYLFLPASVTYCNGMTIEQLVTGGLYNVIDNRAGVYGPKVIGTGGADLILLSDLGNHAQGKDGNDCIIGGAVRDVISGGLGDDQMFGGAGNDHITGRIGADSIFGEDGNDVISGGLGDDQMFGGAGNDHITGRIGADSMFGEDGNDTMSGGPENDSMDGGAGDDMVLGREDDDTMTGGDGNDFCLGEAGADIADASCEISIP